MQGYIIMAREKFKGDEINTKTFYRSLGFRFSPVQFIREHKH